MSSDDGPSRRGDRRAPRRRRVYGLLLLAACTAFLTACDDSSTGPSRAGGLPVAFSLNLAGGAADAFDAADAIAVSIILDDIILSEEVLPFSSGGGDVRIRVPVDGNLDGARLGVAVELRRGTEPLFRGFGSVVASSSASDPVEIPLDPVVAAVVPPPDATIQAIGATLELAAAAVFATGDTIPGEPVAYQLLDQGVIRLLPGGIAVADREGTAGVRASADGRTADFEVEVRIATAFVLVDPPDAIIGIGRTIQLDAQAYDAADAPLDRQPVWSSADSQIATVSAAGLVTGVAAGTVTISATVDDVAGTAEIEVSATPPPATPTGVTASATGTDVTLSWQDVASIETGYEILRGPGGGTLSSIATLPPNSSRYVDAGLPADQVLEYVVSACNGQICSPSARVTARTVPVPPTSLTLVSSNPNTLAFRLGWTDASVAETEFRIEVLESSSNQYVLAGTVPAGATQYNGTATAGTSALYRVRACNAAGCSAPSNVVTVTFGVAPPTAITLPSNTNTEMVGVTDAGGLAHTAWFEFYDDPSFSDPFSTSLVNTVGGSLIEPLFDLKSDQVVYYRIIAQNSAGTTFGGTQSLTAPELVAGSPSSATVCNQGSSCSVDPPTITFSAFSTGPLSTYSNPFQFVSFDLDSPFSSSLGSGTVIETPNVSTGILTIEYRLTIDASLVPDLEGTGVYSLVVRGYPASSSGNVVTTPIIFTVTSS